MDTRARSAQARGTRSDAIDTADHALDPVHVNRWLERAEDQVVGWSRGRCWRSGRRSCPRPGIQPEEFLRFVDGVRSIYREAILMVKDRKRVRRGAEAGV